MIVATWIEPKVLRELWIFIFRNTKWINLSFAKSWQPQSVDMDLRWLLVWSRYHQNSNHPSPLDSTLLKAKLILKEESQREKCLNKSSSVSYMSSNHSNNADTSAASKAHSSIWFNVTILQCLSYVYIMGLEESSWIFMPHCNWILSMKWNTVLLEVYLPWDTNLNLHIVHCIEIEVLQAWTFRLLLFRLEDTS